MKTNAIAIAFKRTAVVVLSLSAWAASAADVVSPQGTAKDAGAIAQQWARYLDPPAAYRFTPTVKLVKKYAFATFDAELYEQANGPKTSQRVLMTFPKNRKGRVPAVVVPFYFPEAMIGFELETEEALPKYAGVTYLKDLAERGYAGISADAYHLTFISVDLPRNDFKRWRQAGAALQAAWPGWTGIGKLTHDTRLLVDMLERDARIDATRIGIIGHSLGGKMAFYAGCLDARIKVIVASDFGIGWTQTNWNDAWYWGDKLAEVRAQGMFHADLLTLSGAKPFCLIAGQYDDADSGAIMRAAHGYEACPERLELIHHGRGHRPPPEATAAGYRFLDRYLK